MARRYGRLNAYDSRIRRCAISGLRFYQSDMVHTKEGTYIHPRFLDEDYGSKARGGGGGTSTLASDSYTRIAIRSLVLARPYGTPLSLRYAGDPANLYRGASY